MIINCFVITLFHVNWLAKLTVFFSLFYIIFFYIGFNFFIFLFLESKKDQEMNYPLIFLNDVIFSTYCNVHFEYIHLGSLNQLD